MPDLTFLALNEWYVAQLLLIDLHDENTNIYIGESLYRRVLSDSARQGHDVCVAKYTEMCVRTNDLPNYYSFIKYAFEYSMENVLGIMFSDKYRQFSLESIVNQFQKNGEDCEFTRMAVVLMLSSASSKSFCSDILKVLCDSGFYSQFVFLGRELYLKGADYRNESKCYYERAVKHGCVWIQNEYNEHFGQKDITGDSAEKVE